MGVACYLRVSSFDQDESLQRGPVEAWCRGHGLEPVWYVDYATGADLGRPEFERLQRDIFMGEVDTVVVWKLDRLSRSLVEGLRTIAQWCEKGIRLVSVTQQLDFSGAVGRMIAGIFFSVAEIELEVKRERMMAGIAIAKAAGKYKGRRPGSKKIPGGPDRVKELRRRMTVPEVARILGCSEKTVQRYSRMAV